MGKRVMMVEREDPRRRREESLRSTSRAPIRVQGSWNVSIIYESRYLKLRPCKDFEIYSTVGVYIHDMENQDSLPSVFQKRRTLAQG